MKTLCKKSLWLMILLCLCGSIAEAARPNILFIVTDDQAPWALGKSGHPHAHTPHLDELFSSGAYLTNSFVVTPVCSPSRASTMTSRYGTELGITDWIHPKSEPDLGLDSAHPTWPQQLKKAGYQTALVGKWHLGMHDHQHPAEFGFGHFMGFRGGGNSVFAPMLEVNGKEQRVQGLTTDILTDEAVRWLRMRDMKSSFAMAVHYRAPHARWLPVRDEDWKPYADLDPQLPHPDYPDLNIQSVKKMTREYLASVSSVDRNVGRILEELDILKLSDKTIVIFTSDHGYNMGHNGIWHKGNGHWVLNTPPPATENIPKGQRPNMYDHSIRVPTAIRWPGVTKPGTIIEETVSNLDWFPTLLAMGQVKQDKSLPLRGRNIVGLLEGNKEGWENDFYAEYSTKHQSKTHMRMYRTSEWKLIKDFLNEGRDELYNLKDDPDETKNLIDSNSKVIQGVIADLSTEIVEKMTELKDPALPKTATK